MRHHRMSLGALLAIVLAGCSDPFGSGDGRAEALIQDLPAGTSTITGSLAGNMHVSVSSDRDTWVDLGSPNAITVPLQVSGAGTTVHGEVDAPARTYSWVRLSLDGVTARLQSGSVIQGTTLTSDVDLTLGGADQRVELIIAVPTFSVAADPSVQRTVVFQLRSTLPAFPSIPLWCRCGHRNSRRPPRGSLRRGRRSRGGPRRSRGAPERSRGAPKRSHRRPRELRWGQRESVGPARWSLSSARNRRGLEIDSGGPHI